MLRRSPMTDLIDRVVRCVGGEGSLRPQLARAGRGRACRCRRDRRARSGHRARCRQPSPGRCPVPCARCRTAGAASGSPGCGAAVGAAGSTAAAFAAAGSAAAASGTRRASGVLTLGCDLQVQSRASAVAGARSPPHCVAAVRLDADQLGDPTATTVADLARPTPDDLPATGEGSRPSPCRSSRRPASGPR